MYKCLQSFTESQTHKEPSQPWASGEVTQSIASLRSDLSCWLCRCGWPYLLPFTVELNETWNIFKNKTHPVKNRGQKDNNDTDSKGIVFLNSKNLYLREFTPHKLTNSNKYSSSRNQKGCIFILNKDSKIYSSFSCFALFLWRLLYSDVHNKIKIYSLKT